jgi:hypothetical protein
MDEHETQEQTHQRHWYAEVVARRAAMLAEENERLRAFIGAVTWLGRHSRTDGGRVHLPRT